MQTRMRIITAFAVVLLILISGSGCGRIGESNLMVGVKDFKDPDAAMEYAGFSIRQPKDTLGGMLIFAEASNNIIVNSVALIYSNGLTFYAELRPEPIDFKGRIASMEELSRQAQVKPTKLPYLFDVAGHQGMIWPPHMNAGDKVPGTAAIYWWDSGVEYRVHGSDKGFTEEKALQVANSAYR